MLSNHELHLISHQIEMLKFKLSLWDTRNKQNLKMKIRKLQKKIDAHNRIINSPLYKALRED